MGRERSPPTRSGHSPELKTTRMRVVEEGGGIEESVLIGARGDAGKAWVWSRGRGGSSKTARGGCNRSGRLKLRYQNTRGSGGRGCVNGVRVRIFIDIFSKHIGIKVL